jgi:hypothetical protein
MNQRPLQELRLRDFRCFREQQTARLAPLTLLVGENSTGKTSFLAAVRAMLEVGSHHGDPDFRAPPYDLGSFREIAYRQDPNGSRGGAESFGLGFQYAGEKGEAVTVDATFNLGDGAAPMLSTVLWSAGDVWVQEHHGAPEIRTDLGCASGSWRLPPLRDPDRRYLYGGDAHAFSRLLRVAVESGKPGKLQPLHGDADAVPTECDQVKLIRLFFENNKFESGALAGAPIRSSPLRTYEPVRLMQDPQGVSIPAFLANMHARNPDEWQKMKSDLEEFGRKSGLFDDMFVKRLGRHEFEPFQLEVRKRGKTGKGARRNLIDVGYGVSQILPLLVELFRHDRASMFLLQQPEVHLHPSAQAELGSLLCATAESQCQLIVETHSDYVLDRILLDIRDKRTDLKPDDVSILYFERDDLSVTIHSIRIDDEGNVLDAPEGYRGFFRDELERVIDY